MSKRRKPLTGKEAAELHAAHDKKQLQDRAAELVAQEQSQPLQWFYLSFADEEFRGAAIMQAHGFMSAVARLTMLGQNPGGECVGAPLPDTELPAENFRNRLLTKEEVKTIWPDAKSLREHEEEENGN